MTNNKSDFQTKKLNREETQRLFQDLHDEYLTKKLFAHFLMRDNYPIAGFRFDSPRKGQPVINVIQILIFSLRSSDHYIALIRHASKFVASGKTRIKYVLMIFRNKSTNFHCDNMFKLLQSTEKCSYLQCDVFGRNINLIKLQILNFDYSYLDQFYQIARDLPTYKG